MKFSRYHNILISTFGIIILFLVIKNHVQSFQKESFYVQRYDLEKTQTIHVIGQVEVLKFSAEEVIIKKHKDIETKLTPRHYYAFDIEGEEYIFTFEYLIEEEDQLILRYMVWLFTKPPFYTASAVVREVDVHETPSQAETHIHFISDDFGCCLLEGKKLRYQWKKQNPKLGFVGSKRDVFGYFYTPHTDVQADLLEHFPFQEMDADYSLLWLGRADLEQPTEVLVSHIKNIAKKVALAQPGTRIFILTPAPSPVAYFDEKINAVVAALQTSFPNNLIAINALIKQQPSWETQLFYKEYGLNEKAYALILNYLDEQLF